MDEPVESPEAARTPARILIVDDEPDVGRELVEMLDGHDVAWVATAADALVELTFDEHALVITDVLMPHVDGLELLRALEALDPALPVMLLVESGEAAAAAEAVRARAFDLLWKPVERELLREAVERGIAARRRAVHTRELEAAERQRLERRSLLLSLLFAEGSDGVLTWDTQGRLVDLSPSVAALTGVDLEHALASEAGETVLFEREPFGGAIEDRARSLAQEPVGSTHSQEVVVRTVEGPAPARLTLSVCELPPAEAGEQPVRWIVGLLQPPLREDLRGRLRRADRLAGAAMLASGAAHEIKNDLGPLLACLTMLEDAGVADPELAELLAIASGCVRRIELAVERICAPLRDPLRALAGSRRAPPPSPLAIAELVRDSVTFVRRSGREPPHAIELEIADELPPIRARAEDVHQIVVNLVVNALEALEGQDRRLSEPAPVRVRLHAEGRRVVLAVEDDGPGIGPEVQDRVFEPFFTTKGARGTGLGLTVVRDLVRSLGGELTIVSAPAITGTCVRVIFERS